MKEITYKYFVAEGETVESVLAAVKAEGDAHQARISAVLETYEADCLWGGRRESPFALGWVWERPVGDFRAKPPMRENFLKPEIERSGDVLYACYKPDQRYKAGKAIKAELKAVGGFDFSGAVSEALKVARRVFGIMDGRSVMCQTAAGQYGGKLVFRIPIGGNYNTTFTPPEGFREIKKSEFVAITEEAE